jgi:hypothetical protein
VNLKNIFINPLATIQVYEHFVLVSIYLFMYLFMVYLIMLSVAQTI